MNDMAMNGSLTVNEKAYRILRLLGKGKGGYSYLAESEGDLVVIKQIHHEPCDSAAKRRHPHSQDACR